MSDISKEELLQARVHMGHLTHKWNPKMAPFLFTEKKGIHIIDLNKTLQGIQKASEALRNISYSGRKIMFVATKKQASLIVEDYAKKLNQPYMTKRWLGGTLTNFATIRKSLKKLNNIHRIKKMVTYQNLAKREKLTIQREQNKLEKILKGISDINRIPSALFVVDVKTERIAIEEALKLGIPIFALIDSNSNPEGIDFPIPGNDDSKDAIEIIIKKISEAIQEGLDKRQKEKGASKTNSFSSSNQNKSDTKERKSTDSIKKNMKKIVSTDDKETENLNKSISNKTKSDKKLKNKFFKKNFINKK